MIRYSFDKLRKYPVGFFSVLIFVGLGVLGFFSARADTLFPPENVRVDSFSACSVSLQWNWSGSPNSDIVFSVQRSENPGFGTGVSKVGNVSTLDSPYTFQDFSILPGEDRYYRVFTEDTNSGTQSPPSTPPVLAETPRLTAPSAPRNLTAAWNDDKDRISLSWEGGVGNNFGGFQVEKSVNGGSFSSIALYQWKDNPSVTFSEPISDNTRLYAYRVRAFNSDEFCEVNASREAAFSGYSNTASVQPVPTVRDIDLRAETLNDTTIQLSWTYDTSFSGVFEIQRDTQDTFTGGQTFAKRVGELAVDAGSGRISFVNSGLSSGVMYYYRLRVVQGDVRSPYVGPVFEETGVAQPTGVHARPVQVDVGVGIATVGLTWVDNSVQEVGYRVERLAAGGTTWEAACAGELLSTDAHSCFDRNVPSGPGRVYSYRVQALGRTRQSPYSLPVQVDLNIFPLRGWAWANAGTSQGNRLGVGWVSLSSENPEAGTGEPYGVFASKTTGELSGYAWSGIQCTDGRERCGYGWLSFNRDELGGCPDSGISPLNCRAILDVTTGQLFGWAKFLAADPAETLWTGWVSLRSSRGGVPHGVCFGTSRSEDGSSCAGDGTFDPPQVPARTVEMSNGVQVPAGMLSGWAWGDNIGGWMQFIGLGSNAEFKVGPACMGSTGCPAGQVCESGRCVPEETVCTRDIDCAAVGGMCRGGVCVTPCTTDANCPPGEECGAGGFCIPSGTDGTDGTSGTGGTGGDGCVFTSNPVIEGSPTTRFSESVRLFVSVPLGCSPDALDWSVGRIDPQGAFVPDSGYGSVSQTGTYTAPAVSPPGVNTLPFIATVKVEVPGTPFSDTQDIRVGDYTPQARAQCDVSNPDNPYVSVQWSGAPRVLHDVEIQRASSESGPFTSLLTLRDQTSPTGGRTDATDIALHGKYYYKVRIFDIAGRSGEIATNVSWTPCEPPTVAPTNVRVFTQDEKTLYANWTDNDTRAGHTFTLERMRVTPARPTFADASVAVRPLSDSSLQLTWTNATNWTPYTHIIQRTTTANGAARFTRDDPSFREFGSDRGAPSRLPTRNASPQTLSFTDTSLLQEGTTYYYQISSCSQVPLAGKYKPQSVALNLTENPSRAVDQPDPACSFFSDVVSATTLLTAPSGLLASARSSSEIQLSWTDNSSREDGYEIFRNGASLPTVSSNPWSDTGLEPDTSYSYKVRAFKNVSGERMYSEFSPTVSARTEMAAAPFLVTLQVTGTGGGSILPNSDPTITCSKVAGASDSICGPFDPPGSSIVFTASHDAGSAFGAWSGCSTLSGDTPPKCTVVGTATVTARFDAVGTLRGSDKLYASVFEIVRGRLGGLSSFVRKTASPLFEEIEMSEVASLKLPRSVSGQEKLHVYGGESFATVWNSFTSFLLKGKDVLVSLLSPESVSVAQSAVDYEQYFGEVTSGFTQAAHRDARDWTYTEWEGLAPNSVYLYRVKSCLGVNCTAWSEEAAGKTLFYNPYVPGGTPVTPLVDGPGGPRIPRPVCARNNFCDYSVLGSVSPVNPATGHVEESEQQCRANANCANVGRSERSFGER